MKELEENIQSIDIREDYLLKKGQFLELLLQDKNQTQNYSIGKH